MLSKVFLDKMLLLPTISYASPIWAFPAKSHLNSLQTVTHKLLRQIRGGQRFISNHTLLRKLGISILELNY